MGAKLRSFRSKSLISKYPPNDLDPTLGPQCDCDPKKLGFAPAMIGDRNGRLCEICCHTSVDDTINDNILSS
jgi:hypothetical protein